MRKNYVVMNVYGGEIQDAFVSDPKCEINLVEWDTEECFPNGESIFKLHKNGGGYDLPHVAQFATAPTRLDGTDVERVLSAAGVILPLSR